MWKICKVAQRDYVETVRTKTFLLGVLMTPVLIAMVLFFAGRGSRAEGGPRAPKVVAVTDLSNELGEAVKPAFDAYNTSHPRQQIVLLEPRAHPDTGASTRPKDFDAEIARQKDRLRRGELDIYVVVNKDVISGAGKMRFYTRRARAADIHVLPAVENLLNRVVVERRCALRNVSPKLLAELRRRVPAERIEVGPAPKDERIRGKRDTLTTLMVPFFFLFMMFMGIFGMGQHIVTSVIEEKSSRVIEVLLSALSPFELMAGKILGLAGIGLTVMALWCGAALAAARWRGVAVSIPFEILPYFVIYYVLGFLLLSSILAGIGSICNTIKEAQSLMMPLTLIFVLPMVSWYILAKYPEGTLARVLSFIPPVTPLVMVLRLAASPDLSPWEVWATIIVLAASVPATMWLAAKVFRTGILMYGKRPGLREVFRWLRQS